jgi:hypothetical protein
MSYFRTVPEPENPLARYRVLSPNAGVRVSPICLGGMSLTNTWYEFPLNFNPRAHQVIQEGTYG